jgi:hypothetical protein
MIDIRKFFPINKRSIDSFFYNYSRNSNDEKNKKREKIIEFIINNKIPKEYYNDEKWLKIKTGINDFLILLKENFTSLHCEYKAGLNNNYDFLIKLDQEDFKIEFKYGKERIDQHPQFVSPSKPSAFFFNSYEEYFYDKYFFKIAQCLSFEIPLKKEYLKKVNSSTFLMEYQELYYKGSKTSSRFTNEETDLKFYNFCNDLSKESIINFVKNNDLNAELLSEYLINSQESKIYMLYPTKMSGFLLQKIDSKDFKIELVTKDKNRYICHCKNGTVINVLLRWKNGNGIAWPALQISIGKNR